VAGILFIISAPSGSGKSTLVNELRKQVSGVDFAVSWTTRAPRGSEENGREYHFASHEEFQRMIDSGMFLEYAEVFGKDLYGTPRQSLDDALAAGRVRPGISPASLFGMISGIPAAAEMSDDPEAEAQLLLAVVLDGLSPSPASGT